MDPDTWIINLFSNKDNEKAFFGDSYENNSEFAEQMEDEDDTIVLSTVEEPYADIENEECTDEEEDEIVAPTFDEDDTVLECKDTELIDEDDEDVHDRRIGGGGGGGGDGDGDGDVGGNGGNDIGQPPKKRAKLKAKHRTNPDTKHIFNLKAKPKPTSNANATSTSNANAKKKQQKQQPIQTLEIIQPTVTGPVKKAKKRSNRDPTIPVTSAKKPKII
jgi:hypothetical protein